VNLQSLTKSVPGTLAGLFALCVAVTIAAYIIVIRPALAQHADEQARSARVAALHDELSASSRRLQQVRVRSTKIHAQLSADAVTLRDVSQLNRKIADLVTTAEACHMTVVELRPQAMKHNRDYLIVPLTVVGAADFNSLRDFLRELRKSHADVTVGTVLSARAATDPRAPALQMELYWHATPDAVSTVKE
jgi:hypothetical protein